MPSTISRHRQASASAKSTVPIYLPYACGYVRVSSAEQARNPRTLPNHIERIQEVIGPDAPVFVDIASRTSKNRPEYEKMKALIDEGEIRHVVVARPDRLGHSKAEGCARVYEWLHRKPSVVTKFLDFDLDLTAPAGRLLLQQLIAVSMFELHMLSLRIRKNKEVLMREGKNFAQPPFGYARQGDKLVIDTYQRHCFLNQAPTGWKPGDPLEDGHSNADLARMLLIAVAETGSYAKALRKMEPYTLTEVSRRASLSRYAMDEENDVYRCVWTTFPPVVSSVRNWCFHPAYRGHVGIRRNWDESRLPGDEAKNRSVINGSRDAYEFFFEDMHEPLIDETTYQQFVALERRHRKSGNPVRTANRQRDPFCGLLVCSDCHLKLKYEGRRSQGKGADEKFYSYYKCQNPNCKSLGLRVATAKLLGMLARRLARIARTVQSGERPVPAPDPVLQGRIEHIDDLVLKMLQMNDPYFDASIEKLLRERRELANEPDEDAEELRGNGWQMLQQSKACSDADWFVFLSRPDLSLHSFLERIIVGYETPEDRPTRAPGAAGRRTAQQSGNPSILDVVPL